MRNRTLWIALATALWLPACDQAAPPPLARERALCADVSADPAPRQAACDAVLALNDLAAADRAAALADRGEAKRLSGDPTAALADFNAALAIDAEHAPAKLGRAEVLLRSGQLDAAAPLIETLLQADAPPARAHYLRGDLYARQGERAAAIAEFDAAIAADAHIADAFAQRGLAEQADRDYAAAARDFDAAVRLNARHAEARAGRCWNRVFQGGDLVASAADAEAAIAADAALVNAQLCRGLVMLRQRNWPEARVAYDAVLLVEPVNAAALFGRGFARRETGERREGAEDIRRAYAFNSDIDEEFERLGVDF